MADIVVGYDGSDCSRAALDAAIELSGELGDRVVAVYSYHLVRLGGEIKDTATALHEMGEKVLAEAADAVRAKGLEVETELVAERPVAEALAELGDLRKARMIVVGTHSQSAIKRAILGSTSRKLLEISVVPVLVVRAAP